MPSEMVEIQCAKCGANMRVHPPVAVRQDNGVISTFSLIPSWSLEERQCKNCKAIMAPVLAPTINYTWGCFEPPKEESRIVTPGPLPVDFARKLKVL